MQVRGIDVHDDAQVRTHWETAKEADEFGRRYAVGWSLRTATVAMRDPNNPFAQHPLVAVEGDEVVGAGLVTLPRLDNTHSAFIGVGVPPAHRRRGVGTALLEAVLKVAADNGRTTVMGETYLPLEDPPALGEHFIVKRGF